MKRDLMIRTEGSADIGLGHVVRCISLAGMLKDDFKITFVYKNIPASLLDDIHKIGRSLQIKKERSFFDELSPGTVVVLDGYQFDTDYQKKIKQTGCSLVCIDDMFDKPFYADLIINHAPGITEKNYDALPCTKFALGPDYVLLRPSFLKTGYQPPKTLAYENILICFGGSDSENLTKRTMNVVFGFNQFKKIFIITGSAYKHEKGLLEILKKDKRAEYFHALDQQQMAQLMIRSDVAIVPASGILFEVLATGTTAISGMYTENQKNVYSGFKKKKAIVDAGTFQVHEIDHAIRSLGSFKKTSIIDGKSPERFKKLFHSLVQKS
jgi:UDP-2,4-diacetamido-2,4,6-trideoxy-beta-L-altropyranose hydrolase